MDYANKKYCDLTKLWIQPQVSLIWVLRPSYFFSVSGFCDALCLSSSIIYIRSSCNFWFSNCVSFPFSGAAVVQLILSLSSLRVPPLPLSSLTDPPPRHWPCPPIPFRLPFAPLPITIRVCSPLRLASRPHPHCFKLLGTQPQPLPYLVRGIWTEGWNRATVIA